MPESFSTFPAGRVEALTLEYVKLHMTAEMSPEDVVRLYQETYQRIRKAFSVKWEV